MEKKTLRFEHPDGVTEEASFQMPPDESLVSWGGSLWQRSLADNVYRLRLVWVPDVEEYTSEHLTEFDLEKFRGRLAKLAAALVDMLVLVGAEPLDASVESVAGTIKRAKEALG